MKKFLGFCSVFIIFASLILHGADGIVDASAIVASYKKNELNAASEYKGNLYSVTGKVTAIEEDSTSKLPSIKIGDGLYALVFLFARDYQDSISEIAVGDTVVIEALCNGVRKASGKSDKVVVFAESSLVSHSVATKEAEVPPAKEETPAPEEATAKNDLPKAKPSSKTATKKTEEKEAEPEKNILPSIVTVEGKKGVGTGFIVDFEGKKAVVTNMHVLFENSSIKLLSINNAEIEPDEIYFAKDRDIAVIFPKDQSMNIASLKIASEMESLKNGAPVAVYGNSMGAGVNTEIFGKISGLGPKTVEVSAKFVPGNSGSPVLLKGTDSVIGVATFAAIYKADWVNAGTRFTDVRRFATRIDNLKLADCQIFKDADYRKDVILYNNMKDICAASYIIVAALQQGRPAIISTDEFPESQVELLRLVKEWNQKANQGFSGDGKKIETQQSSDVSGDFFKNRFQKIKSLIQKTFADARTLRPSYAYVVSSCDDFSDFMTGSALKELDKIDESLKELADAQKKKKASSGNSGKSNKRH